MTDMYLGNEKKNGWCLPWVFANEQASWPMIPSGDWDSETPLSQSQVLLAPEMSVSLVEPSYTKPWQLTLEELPVTHLNWRENCVYPTAFTHFAGYRQTVLWKLSGRERKCFSDPGNNTLGFRNLPPVCSSTARLYIFITTAFPAPCSLSSKRKIRHGKRI